MYFKYFYADYSLLYFKYIPKEFVLEIEYLF